MEDWEDEARSSSTKMEQVKSRWDDEDEDENDVRESWEDEDESPVPKYEPRMSKNATLVPIAEEHHQERIVDEAVSLSKYDLLTGDKNDEKTLENFIPKSESDFMEYADLISHKLHLYEGSLHYIGLLKAVMRLSLTALQAGDAKDVASSVAAVANEKLKVEREANKKKIVAKKKQLNVEEESDGAIIDSYDDFAFT